MKTIRWGIIGCGDVTEVKSGPGFQRAQHSSLDMVMRRNGPLAEDYARRHNVPRWTTDAEEVIFHPEIDAIYVATPPAYHHLYTLQAAKAGKPVYVEKPMAVSYRQCWEMIHACKEAEVPLFVAYYRRALPRFLKIQELLAAEAIGEVRFVTIKQYQRPRIVPESGELPWRVIPEIAGGGLFMDLASHTLDIFDFLLGPIAATAGETANLAGLYEPEDTVTASFAFRSGVLGTAVWNFCAFADVDVNEIVGSRGKLTFSTFGTEPILVTTDAGTTEVATATPQHIQQPLIQTIVDELNGGKPAPSTGESAARTNHIMELILQGSVQDSTEN